MWNLTLVWILPTRQRTIFMNNLYAYLYIHVQMILFHETDGFIWKLGSPLYPLVNHHSPNTKPAISWLILFFQTLNRMKIPIKLAKSWGWTIKLIKHGVKDRTLVDGILLNPLSSICSCDTWIKACRKQWQSKPCQALPAEIVTRRAKKTILEFNAVQ